jgi:mannose-1-phosphate guanylyltransferase
VKAFLLAAGEGLRLRPLTLTTPKCLVPIRGTPLLGIWLELLERHGVSEVLINLHHLPERVREFVAEAKTRLQLSCVHEPKLLGSAGTVARNRGFVEGEEDFLVLYADNLTNAPLSDIVSFHRRRGAVLTLGVTETDRPREKGIVVVDSAGSVVDFEEKPREPRSTLANAGIYVAGQGLFDFIPATEEGAALDFGFHVLPRLAGRMDAFVIPDFLMDIGTPEAYRKAESEWPGL